MSDSMRQPVYKIIDELREEVARLKRGDWTAEELQEFCHRVSEDDKHAFKGGCVDYWAKLFGDAGLEYSVGEDGVERYGFETVTVFRREGREVTVRLFGGRWHATDGSEISIEHTREASEAWCVEQLRPKWRAAREDGSDNGKACRVRDLGQATWNDANRLIATIDHEMKYVVVFRECSSPSVWRYCEVQD